MIRQPDVMKLLQVEVPVTEFRGTIFIKTAIKMREKKHSNSVWKKGQSAAYQGTG